VLRESRMRRKEADDPIAALSRMPWNRAFPPWRVGGEP
jgi:hypothetical protein